MQKKLLLSTITFLFALGCFAQPLNKESYAVMLELAEEYYAMGDYYSALEKYEEAYDERRDNSLNIKMAELHYELRDYVKAERLYRRLIDRAKDDTYNEHKFQYGRVLKMVGKYDKAIDILNEFISETTDETLKELAQNEIAGAEMAEILPENNKGVAVNNLGRNVNIPLSEYSPAMGSDGQLYFAGLDRDLKDAVEVGEDQTHYAKIFTASKTDRGWQKGVPLDEKINRPGYHSNNVSFSVDGDIMYFTRSLLSGNNLTESKIYMSTKDGASWMGAKEVTGVNGEYIATHPAVGELFGKEVLFFVSDMEGGEGGLDIFYATHKGGGVYGDPVSLGPKINTAGEEMTPYYYDGTLFFSSTGHPGIGGADIFYSTWDGSRWSEPKNMGKGYNTNVDDLYFTMYNDGYSGFLTSNRPGGRSAKGRTCCDDMLGFEIPKLYADLVVGVFSEGKEPILGATVSLMETTSGADTPPETKSNAKGNRFDYGLTLEKPYMVVAAAEGYFPDTLTFNTVGLKESKTFQNNFFLKAKPVEPEFITVVDSTPILMENILYEFDKDAITEQAEKDLQLIYDIMTEYPQMKIELRSHTDFRGDAPYNQDLSQRRTESARRWLIRKGIARERIEAKGYGESFPQTVSDKAAAANSFLKAGDVLTEAYIKALATEEMKEIAHGLNRRTEFQIIEGPTSIIIETQRLKKQEVTEDKEAPIKKATGTEKKKTNKKKSRSRNSMIGQTTKDPVQISPMSSLYGKKITKGVPIMTFERRVLDIGKVKRGEKRSFSYRFTNKGDTAMKISLISACDCTTTDYPVRTIKPGETGEIEVIFDSTEKEESETIDVDIFLENTIPGTEEPIVEMLQYKYELIK
jgi:peptidoglycan-associated lipoprotein